MECPFCHSILNESQSFCPHCGKKLIAPDPAANRRTGKLIVFSLILVALLIGVWDLFTGEFPHEVIEEQLQAIRENKLTEAYYAYTSKEFQAATSLDEFKKFLKSFPEIASHDSNDFEDLEDQNNVKMIKGLFQSKTGDHFNILYQLIDQDGKWKILNMKVIPSKDQKEEGKLSQTHLDILTPVQELLKAIEKGSVDKAYEDLTSKDFKKNTSLNAFHDFLLNFPILSSYSKSEILDIAQAGNFAVVKFEFENNLYTTKADFTMLKDTKGWTVHGISIESQDLKQGAKEFNPEVILQPLKEQLKLIQAGDLKKAYETNTAKAFREATPYDQFAEFINTYKVFQTDKSPQFYNLTFNNNVAIYSARFKAADGEVREAEYALIKEEGKWKILQIQIFEKENPPQKVKAK